MIKAAIFDVDGVIVNTDPIASKSYESVLKFFNKQPRYTKHGLVHVSGVREKDMMFMLKEQYEIEETIENLIVKRAEFYKDLLKDLKAQKGLTPLLDLLKKHNLLLAIGTSGRLDKTSIKLNSTKVFHYFNVIVTGDDVAHGKTAPDIFLEASRKLEINPQDCLVFEDSESGVKASKAAGMKVIAVPTKYTKAHDFSKADKVVNSLEDVTWSMILNI